MRPGEELPHERPAATISPHIYPELDGPLTVEQFPSGFSNLTYLLRFGDRELVLRRPPIGAKIKTAHDMSREYRILSHLHPVYQQSAATTPVLRRRSDTRRAVLRDGARDGHHPACAAATWTRSLNRS